MAASPTSTQRAKSTRSSEAKVSHSSPTAASVMRSQRARLMERTGTPPCLLGVGRGRDDGTNVSNMPWRQQSMCVQQWSLLDSAVPSVCPGLPVLFAQLHSAQHGLVLVRKAQLHSTWE